MANKMLRKSSSAQEHDFNFAHGNSYDPQRKSALMQKSNRICADRGQLWALQHVELPQYAPYNKQHPRIMYHT